GRGDLSRRHEDDQCDGADLMTDNKERYEKDVGGSEKGRDAEQRPRYQHSGPGRSSPWPRPGTQGRQTPHAPYTGDRPHEERPLIPGEVLYAGEPVEINTGKDVVTLQVRNTGDRPIQVGSHYHFAEPNPALEFDRDAAWGRHLNVVSGGSMRFEPGDVHEVELVPLGGERAVLGLRGAVQGKLDDNH